MPPWGVSKEVGRRRRAQKIPLKKIVNKMTFSCSGENIFQVFKESAHIRLCFFQEVCNQM
jgi:hypothetical protein